MAILVVVAYAIIARMDPYVLLQQGERRDFYVCSILCVISFSLAFALAMNWEITSPATWLTSWIKQLY